MRSYSHTVKYCSKEVIIEYEFEHGSDPSFLPGHICDGGGDPAIVSILSVTSEQGIMLYTSRQGETWEEEICMIDHGYDDYDDNYM